MKRSKWNKLLALAITLVMAMSLTACGGSGTSATPTPTAAPEKTAFEITVQNGSEPGSIDPSAEIGNDVIDLNMHMFEPLMKIGASGGIEPGQAESYEVSDDGLTYTFHLRDGIKWSDGESVKASDFVYAWQRLVSGGYNYSYFLDEVVNSKEIQAGTADASTLGVAAPDDATFVVTLSAPCTYFIEKCAFGVTAPLRKDIIDEYGDDWCLTPDHFVSNGAYKLSEWVNQEKMIMVKNENYYDIGSVGPDKITWLFVDDANTALASYESGDIIYCSTYPSEEIERLKGLGVFNIQSICGTYYLEVEQGANGCEALQNPTVMKALALAIDRNYICNTILKGTMTPANAWLPSGFTDENGNDYTADTVAWWDNDTYEANCEEAKQLLSDAGYPNGEGFPTFTYLINSSSTHQAIAEYCQSVWKEVLGINCKVESEEWAVFLDTRSSGNYELARAGWTVDIADPADLMDLWISGGGNNDGHWSNADYDTFVEESKIETDTAKRFALIHQAEAVLQEKMPMIPIYFYSTTYIFDSGKYNGFFNYMNYPYFTYMTPAA